MSQENVALVQRALDLVSEGDITGLQSMIGPGFELRENVLAPDAAVYHGEEGLKKWLAASLEAFSDFRFEPERFIERGDWVFARVHAYGRGRGSGAPFEARYVTALKFRSGKAVFAASYEDWMKRSKPPAFRSKTLTPTPDSSCPIDARYYRI